MNEKFLRLITSLNWKEHVTQKRYDDVDYIKVFDVVVRGVTHAIPVKARFWALDRDEVPTRCKISFVLDGDIYPRSDNRSTTLSSSGSIICMLDHAGYMTALKFAIYSHRVSYFKKQAKTILHSQTAI